MHHVSPMPRELLDAEWPSVHRRPFFAPGPDEVRCECQVCRAHTFANPNFEGSGRCGNCGSLDLRPLTATAA